MVVEKEKKFFTNKFRSFESKVERKEEKKENTIIKRRPVLERKYTPISSIKEIGKFWINGEKVSYDKFMANVG